MSNILQSTINVGKLFTVIGIVAVIAIILAALIVLVSKLCFVQEDEKVKEVSSRLAGANCGGCGYAGCADYAKALAEGKATLGACGATSNEDKEEKGNSSLLPVLLVIFAVLGIGGAVTYILIKKNKNKNKNKKEKGDK